MESLDFSPDQIFPEFRCAILEVELDPGLDEVEHIADAGFLLGVHVRLNA